jgi:hypothetical protein
MPLGPYPDFKACVTDKTGKVDDPEAFCAWLEHEITGHWPGENSLNLSKKTIVDYERVSVDNGFERKNGHLVKMSQLKTKTIAGVEIFAPGTHNGDTYTMSDLRGMVDAFYELMGHVDPPVKIGHSSDEFNQALAKKLGVEPMFLNGENGEGAMALGWITKLYIEGPILKGDFSDVPAPIAELVNSKSYNQVSAEIMQNMEIGGKVYPLVLTGVALLGAQLPAVRETAGLDEAVVFTYSLKPGKIVTFDVEHESVTYDEIKMTLDEVEKAVELAIKGKKGAPTIRAFLKDIRSKLSTALKKNADDKIYQEEEMEKILALLGLPPQATEDEAVAAIQVLLDKVAGLESGGMPEMPMDDFVKAIGLEAKSGKEAILNKLSELMSPKNFSDLQKRYADLELKNKTLDTDLKSEKKKNRIAALVAEFKAMPSISGKPEDLANEVYETEIRDENAGASLLKNYKTTNDMLVAAGILTPKGTSREKEGTEETEFEKKVQTYCDEKQVDWNTAFEHVRQENPVIFREYMKNRPRVYAREK